MRFKIIFTLTFSLLNSIIGSAANTTLISLSICDAIEKFYTRYSKNVDIIDIDGSQGELVGKIVENLNNSITVTVHRMQSPRKWTKKLEGQTILLFDNFQSLESFNKADNLNVKFINPIRLLVYCVNTTELEISSLKTNLVIPPYYYFIIAGNGTEMELFTFENRDDLEYCHENQTLIKVNDFSATDLQWTNEPIFPKKYTNFHNCTMVTGALGSDLFLRSVQSQLTTLVTTTGPANDIMEFLSNELNFTNIFSICMNHQCDDYTHYTLELYNIIIIPSISILAIGHFDKDKWNYAMLNVQASPRIYIPTPEHYTPLEKMLLPFEFWTWMSVSITFVVTFIAIAVSHGLDRNKQNMIRCMAIPLLSLKTVRLALGIGRVKLPNGHFCGLVLILFVAWFFALRLIYQTKLVEFIMLGTRKPEIKTLDELRSKNFELHVPPYVKYYSDNGSIEKVFGFNSKVMTENVYESVITEGLFDHSFNGSILSSDLEKEMACYYMEKSLTNYFVPAPLETAQYGFGFFYPNLWNERMKEIIESSVTSGIINRIFEEYTKSKWNSMKADTTSGHLIMELDDLILAFQICVLAYYAALLVFLTELIVSCTLKMYSKGWRGILNIIKTGNFDIDDGDTYSNASASINSSTTGGRSSIVSSSLQVVDIEFDACSSDSGSVVSMDVRSKRYSIPFDETVADIHTKNSGMTVDADFMGIERRIDESEDAIDIKIAD